jgi:hypothetical protein
MRHPLTDPDLSDARGASEDQRCAVQQAQGRDARPNDLTVEIGPGRLTAHAQVLPESARRQIHAVQADLYPGFAGYQGKTTRHIPVVVWTLDRRPT